MGTLEWTAISAIVAIVIAIGGVVVRLMDRINKAEIRSATVDRLEHDLVEHRVAVAREYVSKETLANLETRIVEAINRIGDRLDQILQKRS